MGVKSDHKFNKVLRF